MRGITPQQFFSVRGQAAPLKEIVARLVQGVSFTQRATNDRIAEAWREVVGPEAAAHTRVGRWYGKVLYVDVDSAAWLQELASFCKASILEGLRPRLKGLYIRDIRFRQRAFHSSKRGGKEQGRQ